MPFKWDQLEILPKLNRENWLFEVEFLVKELSPNAKVLQVGCMDGTRIISLLNRRPDLQITGLDIEKKYLRMAEQNIADAGFEAQLVLGDITKPPQLESFNYIICLNNTLGYIPDYEKAVANMRRLGETVIISVYGEKFTDGLAREYFQTIGSEVKNIDGNDIHTKDFGTVKRLSRKEVDSWQGYTQETPIGHVSVINGKQL